MSKKGRKSPGSGRKKTTVAERLSKITFDLEKVRKIAAFYGNTDTQLANVLGINQCTLNRWKKDPTFVQVLKKAKDEADARVEETLYTRAIGYSHNAVKIFMPAGAASPVYADYVEHYPPDPTSMIFWLKNRRPDQWKDRVDVTSNNKTIEGGIIIVNGKTITEA